MLAEMDIRTKLEFLRIATMIGQKIDFIWTMFLSTYITLFGFAIFYEGGVRIPYFIFIVFATGVFTWINFNALWHHYRLQSEMGSIYQKMNTEFPTMDQLLVMYSQPRSERSLIFTHASAFMVFVAFVFDKYQLSSFVGVMLPNK